MVNYITMFSVNNILGWDDDRVYKYSSYFIDYSTRFLTLHPVEKDKKV